MNPHKQWPLVEDMRHPLFCSDILHGQSLQEGGESLLLHILVFAPFVWIPHISCPWEWEQYDPDRKIGWHNKVLLLTCSETVHLL